MVYTLAFRVWMSCILYSLHGCVVCVAFLFLAQMYLFKVNKRNKFVTKKMCVGKEF